MTITTRPKPDSGPAGNVVEFGILADMNAAAPSPDNPIGWTFLSNHTHVLLCVAAEPEMRIRNIADRVGITERAANRILNELVEGGFIERERIGRHNRYRIDLGKHLRHPIEAHATIGDLIATVEPLDPEPT